MQYNQDYSGGFSGHTTTVHHDGASATPAPSLPLGNNGKERYHLVALAAGSRETKKFTGKLRQALQNDCGARNASDCFNPLTATRCQFGKTYVEAGGPKCSLRNLTTLVMQTYRNSLFCLQPAGDSPTRKGIFDAVMAGCIPVLFGFNMVRSYSILTPEVSEMLDDWAVTFSSNEARAHLQRIFRRGHHCYFPPRNHTQIWWGC
jgi:hypothetical protein